MAAHTHRSCRRMLLLAACVSLVVATDCGKECALCVFRLLGQQAAPPSSTCALECDGQLDDQKLLLCRDILLKEQLPADEFPSQEQELAADEQEALEHRLAKKYGGFMKRYGGFMSLRSSPEGMLEDAGNQDEEENIRLQILKILNEAAEHGGEGSGPAGKAIKRYGGFMRRADGEAAQGDLLEAVLGRGLKKRYGGFMRRVGRPEWLVDSSKSTGTLKHALENGNELQKRYGGFMD